MEIEKHATTFNGMSLCESVKHVFGVVPLKQLLALSYWILGMNIMYLIASLYRSIEEY